MRYHRKHRAGKEGGFTIAEIAVVTIITGIVFSAALLIVTNMLSQKFTTVTFKRMEVVADAISIYAQRHMRVPCPADPATAVNAATFGVEANFNAATGFGECIAAAANREGIVPYATLGIPQDYARDAWGNFFTYRVSPVATVDPTTVNLGARQVGKWCSAQPVWYDADRTVHMNIPKAHFCCGARTPGNLSWDQDILLMGPHSTIATPATILMPSRQVANFGGENNDYMQPNAAPPTLGGPPNSDLTGEFASLYPAYVLVGHGANGTGAFLGGGNVIPGTVANGGFLSNEELANGTHTAAGVQFFVTDNISPAEPSATGGGPDLFVDDIDDVVFWQSQAQVMSRVGQTSCARPWNN